MKKPPPHLFCDAAEQAVIGAILISTEAWEDIEGIVVTTDFSRFTGPACIYRV